MSTDNRQRDELLHSFHEELRKLSTETIMFHQAIADQLGLNSTDHKCLDVILEHYPLTAGKLAELTGLTTGTVTGVIDRLEKAGYVYRDKDPEDRRRVLIQVHQEKAEKEITPRFASLSQSINKLFAQYTDDEIKFLLDFVMRNGQVLREETKKLK